MQKLKKILKGFGEYPENYRHFIWRLLLKVIKVNGHDEVKSGILASQPIPSSHPQLQSLGTPLHLHPFSTPLVDTIYLQPPRGLP